MEDENLTIRGLVALLKVGNQNSYTTSQRDELPGFSVCGQQRDVEAWSGRQARCGPADGGRDE